MYVTQEMIDDCCLPKQSLSDVIDIMIKHMPPKNWEVLNKAVKILEGDLYESEKKKCNCPTVNFSLNGIGCKCGGV
jgi:hypothetical protein